MNSQAIGNLLGSTQSNRLSKPSPPPFMYMAPNMPTPKGLLAPGNINLLNRPIVNNPDGSQSTVRSMSFEIGGKNILVPTVSNDGRIMGDQEAIDNYNRTKQHLGIFSSPDAATAYAIQLHKDYEGGHIPGYAKRSK